MPVVGWSGHGTPVARRWTTAGHEDVGVVALADGFWRIDVDVPAVGWVDVEVRRPADEAV